MKSFKVFLNILKSSSTSTSKNIVQNDIHKLGRINTYGCTAKVVVLVMDSFIVC